MKRDTLRFVAWLPLFGFFALALSIQSFADDKKAPKAAVKDIKFACSHHGPANMMLTLSLEKGDPQEIKIVGKNNGKRWFVTIDGQPATDGNGGKNGDTVKVHSGDTITWNNDSAKDVEHGVAFAEQDMAEAMLKFDTTVGNPLEDLTGFLNTQPWKDFGTKRWGTKPVPFVDTPILLVKCKVK